MAPIALAIRRRAETRHGGGFHLKQVFRFFFNPAAFVNQLQWSKNHGLILLSFLAVAFVESQVGAGRVVNHQLSLLVCQLTGLARDHSFFLVVAARIALLFFGALSLAETIWRIGVTLGQNTSRRVLDRRIAVVLTVMLGAYTLNSMQFENAQFAALALFAWGSMLCCFTLREQFSLSVFQAAVLGATAVFLVAVSWKVSDSVVQESASFALSQSATKSKSVH
jgi:branched-subunit amino acid transport protein AzlD